MCASLKNEQNIIKIYMLPCNDDKYQKWELIRGTSLKHVETGLCLTANKAFPQSGQDLLATKCDGSERQKWKFQRTNSI